MSDEELLETYRAAINKAMDEAYARDGFATNMSRESIVAGLRAVFDMSKGETRAEWEAEQGETEWEYLVSHAWDGRQVITTVPQGFSPEQWVVERRQVIPKKILTEWLPVPGTTNNESEGKA